MLPSMLTSSCSISRDVPVGTNGRTKPQVLYANVACLILPMNTTTAIENEFSLGRAYDIYFKAGQDSQIGDLVIQNGQTYSIKAVQSYNVPIAGYVHAMAEQEVS
jgi:hypothetical protein